MRPKISRRKEITKTSKNRNKKITESRNWLFEKISKIDKPLVRLKREKISKQSQMEGEIITTRKEMQRILRC